MRRFLIVVYFFLCLISSGLAISETKDTSVTIFPETRIFPVLFLDPLECQLQGGSYFLFQKDNEVSLYSLVNLGFTKPVFGKSGDLLSWEAKIGAATFTQFDLVKREDGVYLAGLLNNDYKVSADFTIQKKNNVLQLRVFHVSSHHGDDYMLRHKDTIPNDKSVNYEQVDLTYLKKSGNNYWYVGVGEIYTPFVYRDRLSFYGGGLYNFRSSKAVNLYTSVNIKLLAENDFVPDIRSAFGLNFSRKSVSLIRLWIEYYSGQLPYSTFDYGRVNWLGLGMSLNIL